VAGPGQPWAWLCLPAVLCKRTLTHLCRSWASHPLILSPPHPAQILDTKARELPGPDAPLVLLKDARLPQPPGAARQFHARLAFTVTPPPAGTAAGGGAGGPWNFTAGVRLLTGPSSYADVLLEGTAAAPAPGVGGAQQPAPVVLTALRVAVDKRRTGGFTPAGVEGGPVPLPPPGARGAWVLPGKELTLDLFVDHSIVEVYALGGLGRVTSRIYPSDESTAWGLAAFGAASRGAGAALAGAQAWSLNNAWAGQPTLC
jgi:hypothetical protein